MNLHFKDKKMLLLMNSCVMVGPGEYKCTRISLDQFRGIFNANNSNFKSYIGYPNTAKVFWEITGRKIELCRDKTDLRVGDIMLCMRLKYRPPIDEKATRKHGNHIEDYEFFYVTFKEETI